MTAPGGKCWWGEDRDAPLLRAPPFPGSGEVRLAERRAAVPAPRAEAAACVEALRETRVGGTFWARQPSLPERPFILARPSGPDQALLMQQQAAREGAALLFWLPSEACATAIDAQSFAPITGECDPWHLFAAADALWLDGGDPLGLLAAADGHRIRPFGDGFLTSLGNGPEAVAEAAGQQLIGIWRYTDPFHGEETSAAEIIRLLGHWRELIDANRPISAVFGIAFWKRAAVEPLLWGGEGPVPFEPASAEALDAAQGPIALWKARVPADFLAHAEQRGSALLEIEDGFIRSAGLGADCVPPLSIVVDGLHAHYDPAGPSGLEQLLVRGDFPPALLRRARELRELIIATGISKYAVGRASAERRGGTARHILVTGQVEDDRSVLLGGGEVKGNLDLLRRVRALAPDAHIVYRPHPDVDAGHRKGHIPDAEALGLANEIAREVPITALIDMADEVHVLTSLAGFEALMRGKPVTTHGVPFYAGWGLSRDLGPVPARRGIERTLDALVAATLLLYPRYLDPITNLPCPPEVLIERLAAGVKKENGFIVMVRRLQGALTRAIRVLEGVH